MKILIIDDNDNKAIKVEEALKRAIDNAEISRARSSRSGLKMLESQLYDLLILDMVLPVWDNGQPTEDCGAKILCDIQDGSFCRRPSHIICLTAFEAIANSFKDEASKRMVHVVIYNETNTDWSESLCKKAEQIKKRILEADLFPKNNLCDLAIITSYPTVELQEVIKLPGFEGEFHHTDSLHYYKSIWDTSIGKKIDVLACCAPSMGMTAAAITAGKVINRWRPKYLVMTGIAAGTKKGEQNFGDILIAESTYDYGSGKIIETIEGDRKFIPSFVQLKLDTTLHALLQRWQMDQLQADSIRRGWNNPQPNNPKIIIGVLATGAAVIQSKELVDEVLEKSRKVVGLDMEAFGIMHAADLATTPKPKALVVKSVSDFADIEKIDGWQRYAAYTSARFIYEFFTNESELQF